MTSLKTSLINQRDIRAGGSNRAVSSVTTLADLLREEQNYATLQAGLETSWKLAKDAEKRLNES